MSRIKLNETLSKKIKEVCNQSLTMRQACVTLGMNYNTFKRLALLLGCYKPNPTAKGQVKKPSLTKEYIEGILSGKPSTMQMLSNTQ